MKFKLIPWLVNKFLFSKKWIGSDEVDKMYVSYKHDDWRTRFVIRLHGKLDDNFIIRDAGIWINKEFSKSKEGIYVCDVLIKKESINDLYEVIDYSNEIIDEFISKLSFVTYAPVELIEIVSTSPVRVAVNQQFKMAFYTGNYYVKPKKITRKHISNRNRLPERKYIGLLKIATDSLNNNNIDSAFLNYFSILDFIAQDEYKVYTETKCECGKVVEKRINTSNYLQDIFSSYNISKTEYKRIRRLRSKIAHGSGKRNSEFYDELIKYIAKLESVTFSELVKRTKLQPVRVSRPIMSKSTVLLTCIKRRDPIPKKQNSMFNIIDTEYKTRISNTFIRNIRGYHLRKQFHIIPWEPRNSDTLPSVPPYAWPF